MLIASQKGLSDRSFEDSPFWLLPRGALLISALLVSAMPMGSSAQSEDSSAFSSGTAVPSGQLSPRESGGAPAVTDGTPAEVGIPPPIAGESDEQKSESSTQQVIDNGLRQQVPISPGYSTARVKLSLSEAFARMKEQNRNLKKESLTLRSSEIDYEIAFHKMFIPEFTVDVGFNGGQDSRYTVGQLPAVDGSGAGREAYARGLMSATTLTMNLGSYKLFNGWQDWSDWQRSKVSWQQAKLNFEKVFRQTRTDVFSSFYAIKVAQERLDAAQQSRDLARTILELRKAEKQVGKASEDEVSTAEADLARAQDSVREQVNSLRESSLEMNQLLGDPIGTLYDVETKIPDYVPIQLSADQAFKVFMENSPEARDLRFNLRDKEILLQQEEASRLPLPVVEFSGLQMSANQGFFGYDQHAYGTTAPNSANWEFALGVTMSIPLYTREGFMKGRTVEKARLSLERQKMDYTDDIMEFRKVVFNDLANLKQVEQELRNKKRVSQEADAILNRMASRMRTESISRLELRDAVNTARDAAVDFLDAKIAYISAKIQFANLIGLEYLPGDPMR